MAPLGAAPRGLSSREAARYVGLSRQTFLKGVKAGIWPEGLKIGGRRIWDRKALDRRLDRASGLEGEDEDLDALRAEARRRMLAGEV